jgi:hypothetical protein
MLPIYTDQKFVPVPYDEATGRIDTILFGRTENATLRDYRFLKFLRVIDACALNGHVKRFDNRETYKLDQFLLVDHVELRTPPRRTLTEIVGESLSLGQETYFELFAPLRKDFPEYEVGFRCVTDTLHKFCMILFAQALRLEGLSPHGFSPNA